MCPSGSSRFRAAHFCQCYSFHLRQGVRLRQDIGGRIGMTSCDLCPWHQRVRYKDKWSNPCIYALLYMLASYLPPQQFRRVTTNHFLIRPHTHHAAPSQPQAFRFNSSLRIQFIHLQDSRHHTTISSISTCVMFGIF